MFRTQVSFVTMSCFFLMMALSVSCATGPKPMVWQIVLDSLSPICRQSSDIYEPSKVFNTKEECEQSQEYQQDLKTCDGCTLYRQYEFKQFLSYRYRFKCETKNSVYALNRVTNHRDSTFIQVANDKTVSPDKKGLDECQTGLTDLAKKYVQNYFTAQQIDPKFLGPTLEFKVVVGMPTSVLLIMLGNPQKTEIVQTRSDGELTTYLYGKSRYYFKDQKLVDWTIVSN